jgi:N-acetylmuramoyl-L-alanine amidase
MRVGIDAGHSFVTAGKRTPKFPDGSFMKEHEFNSAVARVVIDILRSNNIEVITTYDLRGQVDLSYNDRVTAANMRLCDLFVSIHANAIGDGVNFNSSYGILFLADETRPEHVEFGQFMIDRLAEVYPRKKVLHWIAGSKTQSLCKYSKMPTAILECGFMTNIEDAKLLLNDGYRTACAEAIASGIIDYGKMKGLLKMDENLRNQAFEAIDILARRGFIRDPEVWKSGDLSKPMPVAHTMIILSRIVNDYGNMMDDFDRRRV